MRNFAIERDDESFQVYFFEDGVQVAGACVPEELGIDAESVAWEIGKAFGDPLPSVAVH